MQSTKLYDIRAVVMAYIDSERPPYPHEDFRVFRKARLAALETAYGIRMSHEAVVKEGTRPLLMPFAATAKSFMHANGPRAGFFDDSLITVTIDRMDTPALKLRETEAAHSGVAIGSYPFFKDGRYGANFVMRSDDGDLATQTALDLQRRLEAAGIEPVAGGI